MMFLKQLYPLFPLFLFCLIGCQNTSSEETRQISKDDSKSITESTLIREEGEDAKPPTQLNPDEETEIIEPVTILPSDKASVEENKVVENNLCSEMQKDLGWNKWAIQLIKDYGSPNSCKAISYEDNNPSDQIFGKVEMNWDGFKYSFEGMPPEITIRRLKVQNETINWNNWLQKNQNILVNPSFDVDFGTDTEVDPTIEVYISTDEFLNVSYSISRSASGRVESVGLTSAF